MVFCVSPGPCTVSLFISSKLLLWSLEKDIIGRINIENGKKKAFTMEVSLSELRELVMCREAWHAVIHGVAKSRT